MTAPLDERERAPDPPPAEGRPRADAAPEDDESALDLMAVTGAGPKVATMAVATPSPSAAASALRPTRPRKLPPLAPEDRRAALQVSTFEGMFAVGHVALSGNQIGGNVFTYGYALLLGAGSVHLGVMTALPQLASAAQLVAAHALQHVRSRRRLVMGVCFASRSLFFLAPLLPFVLERERALIAFIGLFGAAALLMQVAGNSWNSWMSDLIPSSLRGRYLSQRNNLCNLVGLLTGLAGAFALDAYAGGPTGASPEADARRTVGFVAVFGVAALLGGVSTLLLRFQAEPAREPGPPPLPFREFVSIPFRDKSFRQVLLVFSIFSFGNGLGNPFWVPYFLEDLGGSYGLLTTLTAAGGVAGLLTLPLWGRTIDRFGARPCLLLFGLVVSLHPLYYLVATPDFRLPIVVDYLSSGIFWNAWNLAALDLLFTIAPAERGRRAMYLAAQAACAGSSLALGSFLSGAVADTIPGGRLTVFLGVSIARWVALFLLTGVEEPGARPLADVLRRARDVALGRGA